MAAVDVFADVGVDLYGEGRLVDGLELLAARLDYAGAGQLVADLLGVDWSPKGSKQNPHPTPRPKPEPRPNPSDPPPKGWRS